MIQEKTSTTNLRIAITFLLIALLWSPFASATEIPEEPASTCIEVSYASDISETCEQQDHGAGCEDCTELGCTNCALFSCGVCKLSLHDNGAALYRPHSLAKSNSLDLGDLGAFSKAPSGLFRPPRA